MHNYDPGEFPNRIEIELTNECNSTCAYCPRRFMKYNIGYMEFPLFSRIIDEISSYPDRTIVLFRRGESLLHPKFLDILAYCKGKFKDIQLATNASHLNSDAAKAIADTVSFISFSLELPERYKKVRKLEYTDVIKNVDYFLKINKKAQTQVSVVATDDMSIVDIEKFKEAWVNRVDRVRIYEEHSKDGKFGSLAGEKKKRKACAKPFNDILIFWDGMTGRCNHDWGEEPLESVVDNSIRDVWLGERWNNLRGQHKRLKIYDKVCSKCDSWYDKIGICDVGYAYEKNERS